MPPESSLRFNYGKFEALIDEGVAEYEEWKIAYDAFNDRTREYFAEIALRYDPPREVQE